MRQRRSEARLVGRDQELERIGAVADDPTVGCVLLTGPTGVGRSRLAEGALIGLVARGWRGFGLSATAQGARIPYGALSELIPDALDRVVDHDPAQVGLVVLRALEDALGLDRSEPVAVVLDDVASIDQPSCELLVHLAANRRLFLIATRADGSASAEALRRLTPAGVVEVAVEPLTVTGTAGLAAEELGGPVGPGLVRALHDRSRGYPLFVCELLSAATDRGIVAQLDGIHQLVDELTVDAGFGRRIVFRFGLLSQPELDVLELLALAGQLGLEELASVAGVPTLEVMERRGLITTGSDGRRLRVAHAHPLHGEAVLAGLTPLVLRRRHREVADLVGRWKGRRAEDRVVRAVAGMAGGLDVAVDELLSGVTEALRLDRVRDAAHLAGAAHRADPSEATRAALAEALIRQGRYVEADRLLAEPLGEGADDWVRLRRAIRRSSNQLWGFGDAAEAHRIDEECLVGLSDQDAVDRVVAHQAWIDYSDGWPLRALDRVAHLERPRHPDLRYAVAVVRAPAQVLAGRLDEGAELAQRAWDESWGADTEYGTKGQHLIGLGFAHLYRGDVAAARFVAEAAIAVCRESHETPALLFFLDLAAWTELAAGELAAARSYFEEALAIGGDLALASAVRSSLAGLVTCLAQLGEAAETATTWRRLDDVPEVPGPRGGIEVAVAHGWATAVGGDPAEAAELFRTAAATAGERGLAVTGLLALVDLARLGYATPSDGGAASALADRCQGELPALLGRAVVALAEPVSPSPSAGDRVEPAATRAGELDDLAAELGRLGFRVWAGELAERAADAWAASGRPRSATASQLVADRQREGLEVAATPGLSRPVSVDPLTRREREIAAMAAGGASNAAIAERLHVSVRTVETHLGRTYRKLGVSGRSDLAAALGVTG